MGPFWLMPKVRRPGNENAAGVPDSVDEDVETEAAEDRRSALDFIGAMPHLPLTQPPTSPVNPPADDRCPSCCEGGSLAMSVSAATLELTLRGGRESSADGEFAELELKDLIGLEAVYSVTVASAGVEGILRAAEGARAKYDLLPCSKLEDWDLEDAGRCAMCMSIPEMETRESWEAVRRTPGRMTATVSSYEVGDIDMSSFKASVVRVELCAGSSSTMIIGNAEFLNSCNCSTDVPESGGSGWI